MNGNRRRLAFVSPVFLFPNDAGGKIRTTNILRGLKGGKFEILLTGPASPEQCLRWADSLGEVCDHFSPWQPSMSAPKWRRLLQLFGALPLSVAQDRTPQGIAALKQLAARDDLDGVVFDFVHSAILRPPALPYPTICFTHNVEAEIFGRHATTARNPLKRAIWRSQYSKMQRFEAEALASFTTVIAVSDRDARYFTEIYGIDGARAIPTGVDLSFFKWHLPPKPGDSTPATVVFTGSMNWEANIDGVRYFLDRIWPRVVAERPSARFLVVGRDPPQWLVSRSRETRNFAVTGFVDDVRPYVHSAQAFVIPLRVGGGTRIKAFEAMAMGCPIVSTSLGVEGLGISPDEHFLCRDDPTGFAQAIVALLDDASLRETLSLGARQCVERHYSHAVAAKAFEDICEEALFRDSRSNVAVGRAIAKSASD